MVDAQAPGVRGSAAGPADRTGRGGLAGSGAARAGGLHLLSRAHAAIESSRRPRRHRAQPDRLPGGQSRRAGAIRDSSTPGGPWALSTWSICICGGAGSGCGVPRAGGGPCGSRSRRRASPSTTPCFRDRPSPRELHFYPGAGQHRALVGTGALWVTAEPLSVTGDELAEVRRQFALLVAADPWASRMPAAVYGQPVRDDDGGWWLVDSTGTGCRLLETGGPALAVAGPVGRRAADGLRGVERVRTASPQRAAR